MSPPRADALQGCVPGTAAASRKLATLAVVLYALLRRTLVVTLRRR